MNVLLLQLDGKLPNLALMRVAAHHRARGDFVTLSRTGNLRQMEFLLPEADRVYASAIFDWSRPAAEGVQRLYGERAVLGGTGWNMATTLAEVGIAEDTPPDYADYPRFPHSIGFSQRGCRLKCGFCVVPRKEGAVRAADGIAAIWRGEPWPRHVILLDNDFFGQPAWRERIAEIRDGGFKVSFCQGINARMLTDETAAAIASVRFCDSKFTTRRLYTAWDNRKDEHRLFAGLEALTRHGVAASSIMVYMLIGYWPGETFDDWNYRRARLRAFGAVPYPMPYRRTKLTQDFGRWVIGGHDKHWTWTDWIAAGYQSRGINKMAVQRDRQATLFA